MGNTVSELQALGKQLKDGLDDTITFSSGVYLNYWRNLNLNTGMAEIRPTTFYRCSGLRKHVRLCGILSSFMIKIIGVLDTSWLLSS